MKIPHGNLPGDNPNLLRSCQRRSDRKIPHVRPDDGVSSLDLSRLTVRSHSTELPKDRPCVACPPRSLGNRGATALDPGAPAILTGLFLIHTASNRRNSSAHPPPGG